MLGEQIAELKGKMMGQRVLDSEGPTLETSVSARGSIKGIVCSIILIAFFLSAISHLYGLND